MIHCKALSFRVDGRERRRRSRRKSRERGRGWQKEREMKSDEKGGSRVS